MTSTSSSFLDQISSDLVVVHPPKYCDAVYHIASKVASGTLMRSDSGVPFVLGYFSTRTDTTPRKILFYLSKHKDILANASRKPIDHFFLSGRYVASTFVLIARLFADKSIYSNAEGPTEEIIFPVEQVSEVPLGVEQLWITWNEELEQFGNVNHFDQVTPIWLKEAWRTMGEERRGLTKIAFYTAMEFTIRHEFAHHSHQHFEDNHQSRHQKELVADTEAITHTLFRLTGTGFRREQIYVAKTIGILATFLIFHLHQVLQCPSNILTREDQGYPSISERVSNLLDIAFDGTRRGTMHGEEFFKCHRLVISIAGVHPAFSYSIGAPWESSRK